MMKLTAQFRASLAAAKEVPLPIPVVYNALTAQLAAHAGFPAVWLGGSAIANTLMGLPDVGYMNLNEMEYVLRRATATAEIPILVDIDAGYGSAVQVVHTIRTIESCGAAGVQLEDQYNPRTPFAGTALVIPVEEALGKIKAAVDTRKDPDFLIQARTDSVWTEGLDRAIERANLYAEAGADALFIPAKFTPAQEARIGREVNIRHKMWFRSKPQPSLKEIRKMGFDMIVLGNMMHATALAVSRYLQDLHDRGLEAEEEFQKQFTGTPLEDWGQFTGFPAVREHERKYLPEAEYKARYGIDPKASVTAEAWKPWGV
jgi:2-methylisocitrate lyase-like PEP mutase family enzyme